MEISKLSENAIKIKSKSAIIGADPTAGKGPIDLALLLDGILTKDEVISEGNPVIISGPGEYEVKGIKLSGFGKENAVVYSARVDNVRVCIMKASSLPKAKDILEECEIAIINADCVPDQKLLVSLNPNVVVLYGANSKESAKTLGKETAPVGKYAVTRDKLPSEMEVVILG